MGIVSSQFDKREDSDITKLHRAYEYLFRSVSDTGRGPLFEPDDQKQTDEAVSACIYYCGAIPGKVTDEEADLMERIEYLCRPSGIMHRTVRLDGKWYKHGFGAMVGKLKTGEVVALLPGRITGFSYKDPNTGQPVRVNKKNAAELEETAELFYPAFPSKKMSRHDLFRFVLKRLDTGDLFLVIFSAVLSMLVGLLPAIVTSIAYGIVAPSGMARLIAPIVALLFGVSVSTLLLRMFRNLVISRISIKLSIYTEAATFSRILMLPPSFFRQYSPGSLAFKQAQMVQVVEAMTNTVLGGGLTFVLSIIYFIQLYHYARNLVPAVALVLFIQCLVIYFAFRSSLKYEEQAQSANSAASGTASSLLKGVQKIKLAGAQNRAFAIWANKYAGYTGAVYQRPALLYIIEAVIAAIGMLGMIAIYLAAIQSKVQTSDFMAFNTSYGQITAAMLTVFSVMGSIVSAVSSAKLIKPILDEVPEVAEEKPIVKNITGSVELNGVSFRYDKDSPWILNHLNISIRPGEYIGIVGRSGCGKSTLIRVLLGFEKPEFGRVMYDSNNVQEVDPRFLRSKAVSVVLQDSKLFRADIYHNIVLSSPDATLQDAWEAAEIAGIADDIRKMPMGMNTLVSEGSGGISGGQRQRILIARAVCSKRKVLIMDEATSALDNITQKHVADALADLKCTRIVVAHRLSTVKHCDRILVLDKGSVAEAGTYEELIAKNGIFAELVERQRLEGA